MRQWGQQYIRVRLLLYICWKACFNCGGSEMKAPRFLFCVYCSTFFFFFFLTWKYRRLARDDCDGSYCSSRWLSRGGTRAVRHWLADGPPMLAWELGYCFVEPCAVFPWWCSQLMLLGAAVFAHRRRLPWPFFWYQLPGVFLLSYYIRTGTKDAPTSSRLVFCFFSVCNCEWGWGEKRKSIALIQDKKTFWF